MSPVATARQLQMPVLSGVEGPVLSGVEGPVLSGVEGPVLSGVEGPVVVATVLSPKRVRADALPEYTRYRDDGCDIHPTCLSCPLPRCRYEEPGGLRALLNAYRDRQIVRLRLKGVPVDDLAGRFSVSRRTVFRVLEACPERSRRGSGAGQRAKRREGAVAPVFLRRSDLGRSNAMPVLSAAEGPVLSAAEGPVLSAAAGPVLSAAEEREEHCA